MKHPPTQHIVVAHLVYQLLDDLVLTKIEARMASDDLRERAKESRGIARTMDKKRGKSVHILEAEVYEALAKLLSHPDSCHPE